MLAECHRVRYDYSYTAEEHLNMTYRHQGIVRELTYLDADIVCAQEVELTYYNDQLYPTMKSLGYDGFFVKRVGERYPEGEATFFKCSRFTLLQNSSVSYADLIEEEISRSSHSPEVQDALRSYLKREAILAIARLRCNVSGCELVVGNTHITWASSCPDIQCIQMALAVSQVLKFADGGSVPFVIAGDFNSSPSAPSYQLVQDGHLHEQNAGRLLAVCNVDCPDRKAAAFDLLRDVFCHPGTGIKSTYAHVQGSEPAVTTWNVLMYDSVDYLWFSRLDAVGIWKVPSLTQCIPTAAIPSDHLSLKAEYSFLFES